MGGKATQVLAHGLVYLNSTVARLFLSISVSGQGVEFLKVQSNQPKTTLHLYPSNALSLLFIYFVVIHYLVLLISYSTTKYLY